MFDIGELKHAKPPLACSDFAFVRWLSLEKIIHSGIVVRASNLEIIKALENNALVNSEVIVRLLNLENDPPPASISYEHVTTENDLFSDFMNEFRSFIRSK